MKQYLSKCDIAISLSCCIFMAALTAVHPLTAAAESDYSDKDFSVRLPPAFVRLTEVSALGGDTAANRTSSSINPASAGWTSLPPDGNIIVAPAYSASLFSSGTDVHVISESLTCDTGQWGTFQPVFNQIRTNKDTDRTGLEFEYNVNTAMLQWAKRFDNFGFGAAYSYHEAEVINSTEIARVARTAADVSRYRFGALYEPVEKYLGGLVFEYGHSPYQTDAVAPTPIGPVNVHLDGTEEQYILRPAFSYEYASMSTAFVDYEVGRYHSSRDQLNDNRFSAGLEHRLLEGLFLRTTASIDARGNAGWSAGATAFVAACCSMDVGYQYNIFPELHPDFGYSNTIQGTLSARF
jgi:hypothetical protein